MKLLTFTFLISTLAWATPEIAEKHWTTTSHSKHKSLNKNFVHGKDITKACNSCHTEADEQFRKTIHWTWKVPGHPKLGKAGNSLNNFCITANKFKDKSCSDCHPSWNADPENGAVNCLVCHSSSTMNFNEATENIKEFLAENDPDSTEMAREIQIELRQAATSIGLPTRENCGQCHFYGGGGDGVKHGDLDSSLKHPKRTLDVHMGTDGGNFSCTRCHTTHEHNIAGRMYTLPASKHKKSLVEDDQASKITCVSCHTSKPHGDDFKLDDHTDIVACQTCHIPLLAREKPTKVWWDWSKAGKKKDGKPYREKDKLGKFSYLSHKGEMTWAKNIEPEYFWFNGSIDGISIDEKFDPSSGHLWVNQPVGKPGEGLIYPFKVHRGKQPYDTVHNILLTPLLSGESGYWGLLDWDKPLRDGAKVMGHPYSGKYDFIKTSYVYPSTHMVAPKEMALSCNDCHQKNGRLRDIAGVYMPGRDRVNVLSILGWIGVALALIGVSIHGFIRVYSSKKRGN